MVTEGNGKNVGVGVFVSRITVGLAEIEAAMVCVGVIVSANPKVGVSVGEGSGVEEVTVAEMVTLVVVSGVNVTVPVTADPFVAVGEGERVGVAVSVTICCSEAPRTEKEPRTATINTSKNWITTHNPTLFKYDPNLVVFSALLGMNRTILCMIIFQLRC